MNRLQVGGLALVINALIEENVGSIVYLVAYEGKYFGLTDAWEVKAPEKLRTVCGMRSTRGFISAKNLLPLGDDKGIELYNLQEELVEEQSQ